MAFSLEKQGITVPEVHRNATPAYLYEAALKFEKGSTISSTGALIAYSGEKTGRSPKDKRIVDHPESRDDVWWGNVNIKLDQQTLHDQPRAGDRLSRTRASGCTSSTALPAGIRSTGSRSA